MSNSLGINNHLSWLDWAKESLLNLVLPSVCFGCGSLGKTLCKDCWQTISWHSLPFVIDREELKDSGLVQVWAAAPYQGAIKAIVHAAKYQSIGAAAKLAGWLLWYTQPLPQVDCLVPVPLHPKKEKQRGFNQAQIMAEELSQLTSIPVKKLLIRTLNTPSQTQQPDRVARLAALSSCFQVAVKQNHESSNQASNRAPNNQVSNQTPDQAFPKKILLVDDVFTTGATLAACARSLQKQGVLRVEAITLAHGE